MIIANEEAMRQTIHPAYHRTTITCACGAQLETGSTEKSPHTEICSQCHPFYTGKKKMVDTTGRVDRFKKITERSAKKQKEVSEIKQARVKRTRQVPEQKKTSNKVQENQ